MLLVRSKFFKAFSIFLVSSLLLTSIATAMTCVDALQSRIEIHKSELKEEKAKTEERISLLNAGRRKESKSFLNWLGIKPAEHSEIVVLSFNNLKHNVIFE